MLVREPDALIAHVRFDEGVWKRNYGEGIRAPPDEGDGNRQTGPNVTAPRPYSTVTIASTTLRRPPPLKSTRSAAVPKKVIV